MKIPRRDVIALLGAAAAAPVLRPFASRAQGAVKRVGVMIQLAEGDPEGQARLAAFSDALAKLGWKVGGNLRIDYWWGTSTDERASTAAAEMMKSAPDAILANSSVALHAAQHATSTVPIVFTTVIEPVAQGFVASLAHPGGNTTGFSFLELSVGGKWLDLLKEIAPGLTHAALLFNAQRGPYGAGMSDSAKEAAQKLGLQYAPAPVLEAGDIEAALAPLAREPGGGFIVSPDALTVTHSRDIIALAARLRLPAIYAGRNFASDGGLISYGPNYLDHFRQAATYVDRVLRGEKPADLPVQRASKFDLVINLKTAAALGLTVSNSLQLLADEVIE